MPFFVLKHDATNTDCLYMLICKSVDIAAFISLIHFEPGTLFEVRIPKVGPKHWTYAGYFTDAAKAAVAINKFDVIHKPAGIYISLNPVISGKKKRKKPKTGEEFVVDMKTTNSIGYAGAGTQMGNEDAARRNWFFVDIDPDRPAGTSSTESQMNNSIALADVIESELGILGWPAPVRAMSGNGAYLLYRTDEPNSPESDVLFEDCLYALIQEYSPHALESGEKPYGAIGIDKSVHNASRIAKAIGTFARKGIHVPSTIRSDEQPHRQSWFVPPESPSEPVSTQLLNDLASRRKGKRKETTQVRASVNYTPSYGSELPANDPIIAETIAEAVAKLKKIPMKFADDRDSWLKIGMALHYAHHSLLPAWIEFSKQSTSYKEGECEAIWNKTDKSGGITCDTLNHYIPNEFATTKHVQPRLSMILDVDDDDQRLMILSDCLAWNRLQFSPMSDGEFGKVFSNLCRIEQKRRSVRGKGVTSSPAVDDSVVSDPVESDLPPMPAEIAKVVGSTTKAIDRIAAKETLTDDDAKKLNQIIGKQHRAMSGSALSPAVESLVSSWQLYRADEDPPVLTLEFYDSLSEKRHRVDLSPEQLLSYLHSSTAVVRQTPCRLPDLLAKPWRSVTNYLIDNQKLISGDKQRDITAAIARHILYTCLRGVHPIEVIKNFQNKNSVLHSEVVFRQGNPRHPDAFWFKFDTMFLEVNENFRDSKTTRANISKLLGKCGAVSKRLSNHWTIRRERMMCLDSNAFKSLCEIAGVEWSIGDFAGNDNTHPTSERSINKSFESDSGEGSINATDTATRHNIDDTEFKHGCLDTDKT